jgi:hypothetical protein
MDFQRVTAADVPLLKAWIGRPHVAAWWDGPIELDPGIEQYLAMLGGEPPRIGHLEPPTVTVSGHRLVRLDIADLLGRSRGWVLHDPRGHAPESERADGRCLLARRSRGHEHPGRTRRPVTRAVDRRAAEGLEVDHERLSRKGQRENGFSIRTPS